MQFSVGGLVVVVTAVSIVVALWSNGANRQRRALEALQQFNVVMTFDYQYDDNGVFDPDRTSRWPAWVRRLVGEEYFRRVVRIRVEGEDFSDNDLHNLTALRGLSKCSLVNTKISGSGIELLARARYLSELRLIGSELSDSSLIQLSKSASLERLHIVDAKNITDNGLSGLPWMENLRVLWLIRLDITDEGLKHLESMKSIQTIRLNGEQLTSEGVEQLRSRLQGAEVHLY